MGGWVGGGVYRADKGQTKGGTGGGGATDEFHKPHIIRR